MKVSIKRFHKNEEYKENTNAFFIEGGGTRGLLAVGVLKYLIEPNKFVQLKDIHIFGGTSVGSYLAAALSLGYSVNDITKMCETVDTYKLVDRPLHYPYSFYRFCTRGYFYDDTYRLDVIKQILNLGFDQIRQILSSQNLFSPQNLSSAMDLTFGHLRQLIFIDPSRFKHLIINAVDISASKQIFFTTLDSKSDNIRLFDAIAASSALPTIYQPVTLNRYPDGTYGYDKTIGTTNMLIDGGCDTNNPLCYFLINNVLYANTNLWLLKFISQPKYVKIDGVLTLLKQLLDYLIHKGCDIQMNLLHREYKIDTINLHSDAGTLDMYTPDEIKLMIEKVYIQCMNGEIQFEQ